MADSVWLNARVRRPGPRRGIKQSPRRLRATLAALLLVLPLAACQQQQAEQPAAGAEGGDAEPVELRMTWWGNDARAELTNTVLDQFEEQNPNITVTREFIGGFSDYWDRLATQTAGGSTPDVIQMSTSYIIEYSERGVLLDLSPYVPDILGTDDLPASAMAPYEAEGLYGIPWTGNVWTLYYNEALFEEAGVPPPPEDLESWTWEDFAQAAQQISDNTPEGVYGVVDPGRADTTFAVWLRQQGKSLFTDDNQLGFTREDLVEFWTFTNQLRQSGATTPAGMTSATADSLEQSPLATGEAAMEFRWSNQLVALTEVGGGPEALPLNLHRMPGEAPQPGQYLHASQLLSAAASTEHPEEAAQLIDFLLNDVDAGQVLGTDRGAPLNTVVADAVEGAIEPLEAEEFAFLSAAQDALPEAPPPHPLGGGQIVTQLFPLVYESIMFDQLSVEEAVDQFFVEAEGILESS